MPQFMKFRRIIQNGQTVFRLKGSPIGNLFLGESRVKKINLRLSFLVKNNMFIKEKKKKGDIAQLGERLNGIQEVSGSTPLISTTRNTELNH